MMNMMTMWASMMTMMIMWVCLMTMMIMYDDYDRDEAYDEHLEGCVDPAIDRGWTDRAQDGALPARPAVDRRVVIIPVSNVPPLHDTTVQLSSCSLSYLMSTSLHLSVGRNWQLRT